MLFCFHIAVIEGKLEKFCDVISSDDKKPCYRKETLTRIAHCPNQLAVDTASNVLYFTVDSGHNSFSPAFISLNAPEKSRQIGILRGIKDAFAITSDNKNFDMYFGGHSGIYKYNTVFKNLKRLYIENLDIWWLFVKKSIYFIRFPSLKAYSYTNKSMRLVPELEDYVVYQFVVDSRSNIFFINETGLYGIIRQYEQPVLFKDNATFLGISMDNKDSVYVYSDDGIYVVSRVKMLLVKFMNVPDVTGITFDKANNIIYSDSKEITRLLPFTVEEFGNNREMESYRI